MPKIITLADIHINLLKIHGDLVTIDSSTYKNATTKARFIDKEYGEWWALPSRVLRGSRHTNNSTKVNGNYLVWV